MWDSRLPAPADNEARPWRLAFIGDESLVAQCAEIARRQGLPVAVIATVNPQVRSYADGAGIDCIDSSGDLATQLSAYDFDALLSVANLRVLPDDVLALAPLNINFHDGPLPGYAGLNVTSHAILRGETEHAITWHLMTSDVDGGDVIATEPLPILSDDTAFSLNARCYEAGVGSFGHIAVGLAARSLPATPQPPGEPRVFRRFERPAAILDPMASAVETDRVRRALSFGSRYRNILGSLRVVLGDDVYVVDRSAALPRTTDAAPGTIVAIDDTGVRVSTVEGDLLLAEVSGPAGESSCGRRMVTDRGLGVGDAFPAAPESLVAAFTGADGDLARNETFWLGRLVGLEPTDVPRVSLTPTDTRWSTRSVPLPSGADTDDVVSAIAGWLARVSGTGRAVTAYHDATTRGVARSLAPLVHRPITMIDVTPGVTFAGLRALVVDERATLQRRGPFLLDLLGRDPRTREQRPSAPVSIDLDAVAALEFDDATVLAFAVETATGTPTLELHHRNDAIDAAHAERAAEQILTLLAGGLASPDTAVHDLPLVGAAETALLDAINSTAVAYDHAATLDELFRAQARRTPSAKALSFGSRTLTYAELRDAVNVRSAQLRAAGIGRGDRVGIALPRGIDMVVSVLATLDRGAAYVPLDPTYPDDRLDFMVDDSGIKGLVAEGEIAVRLSRPGLALVHPNDPDVTSDPSAHDHVATDLAYVIYTSGSTGKPKGVMLTHRNVNNFFVAMDDKIDHETPGVWLSVTSLSFDISVLELLWTLTRGYHVVVKADRGIPVHGAVSNGAEAALAAEAPMGTRPVSMSLYYFAAGESEAAEGYRLLLEGAKFADDNGFEAVWTPERHFHAFGGLYPNPAVVSAAIAAHTTNVRIRAGSVVLPLHSPVRVAEEWAVVDNLSHGRVGISFAAGWQPNDFVLNPAKYGSAKSELPHMIDTVRRLWRGETIEFPGHDGSPVHIRTLPRPVQPELECWLTSAGSTSTFVQAGSLGHNLLTHLLGQSVEQLASNIAEYRRAWREAGHSGEGRVTLMLHTFIDTDTERAKERARLPLKGYLGTAAGLLKDMASAFPTFAGSGKDADEAFKSLSADEFDQLLDMATARYLETSGLFGTPHEAAHMIERVSAVGVDEVACLIDFGIETQTVLDSFGLLRETKQIVDTHRRAAATAPAPRVAEVIDVADDTVAALTEKHGVTHLQCTPSLAAMLVADPADRNALRSLRHMMVGGEALPAALATELRELLPARFTNMYGPTETTIWSLTHELASAPAGAVPIGLPIANTTIFVLDERGRPLPMGAFGELHIGGDGVARGYHDRPDLTAERFVDRPGMGVVYATGDVARIHPIGTVEFAGRSDNQVKIRGHRIELGEIESVLDAHPGVVQSVVVARSDTGSPQLVAYVVARGDRHVDGDILRRHVADELPDIMVPAVVVTLGAFPLTPNGKVDRKALPAPPAGSAASAVDADVVPPADDQEQLVAQIWTEQLGRPVSRDDNFFEIGGHSLLAVQVFRRLTESTDVPLALTDIFRFPTIRAFAAHLRSMSGTPAPDAPSGEPASTAPTATDRGAMRRRALSRRGGS